MTIGRLTSTGQAMAIKEVLATNDVRTLVANHLGISVARVTDEAHFSNDLGADWLDRLDLIMAVEDRFAALYTKVQQNLSKGAEAQLVIAQNGWLRIRNPPPPPASLPGGLGSCS